MDTINSDKLVAIVKAYKAQFPTIIPKEIYKWKALKHFQDNWNPDATDFKKMLDQSLNLTENLLASANYFPRKMLNIFCGIDQQRVREMFKTLFDETADLPQRISDFQAKAAELLKHCKNGEKMHYQSFNAITTYLWLRYPDKYYIYKYSCAREITQGIDAAFVPTKGLNANQLVQIIGIYDQIADFLRKDQEIHTLLEKFLTDDCHKDESLHTTVIDLAYYYKHHYVPLEQQAHLQPHFIDKNTSDETEMPSMPAEESNKPYGKEDFLAEVFMDGESYDMLKHLIRTKKNVILQGAPGVGKTFCARRLAWAMMGEKNDIRITFVQFHQNYTYEDFIMGYKPDGDTFKLQTGLFYKACIAAAKAPGQDYFFLIDEINRGNLSKIFGELLMLIEKDYRETSLSLAYNGEKFYVPKNLYIIGMMNTADRSLAFIDYALRRRFSFFELSPAFDSQGFRSYQETVNNDHFNKLVELIKDLNKQIADDDSLGHGFEIGHSYLYTNKTNVCDQWLKSVINFDIIPMLREYWFDNKKEAENWATRLNSIFNDQG